MLSSNRYLLTPRSKEVTEAVYFSVHQQVSQKSPGVPYKLIPTSISQEQLEVCGHSVLATMAASCTAADTPGLIPVVVEAGRHFLQQLWTVCARWADKEMNRYEPDFIVSMSRLSPVQNLRKHSTVPGCG